LKAAKVLFQPILQIDTKYYGVKNLSCPSGQTGLICSKLANAAVIAENPFENSNKPSLFDKN
jgi:hypothetical protein